MGDKHIGESSGLTIGQARQYFDELELTEFGPSVAGPILYEIRKRLQYLDEIGLDYLTLERLAYTLNGGEFQRISLSNALGSSLIGSKYVIDEPTIGLPPPRPRPIDKYIRVSFEILEIPYL